MNTNQIQSLIRLLFAAGGPLTAWLATRGLDPKQVSGFAEAVITLLAVSGPIVSGIWSWYAHTDSNQLKAVEDMPDVKTIVVKKTATDGVATAAADTDRPKVVTETGAGSKK